MTTSRSAAPLFRISLIKNKIALFRMIIYYNIIILWHDFILYRMIINKNFGMILFLLRLDPLFSSFLFRIILNIQICKIK